MVILELIMSYFLKPQGGGCISMARIAGYLFLLVGGGIGLFFLFQALVPLIGYLESGALISAVLVGIGVIFLIFAHKKKPTRPLDNILGEAQNVFKSVNAEKMLKNNVHKVLLFSFLGGLVLSQLKDAKALAQLKDKLPHLKDFLK
jgi:preprotein translocase subunit SecG